ncbi:Fibronectin-like, partial [Homarus americanus]
VHLILAIEGHSQQAATLILKEQLHKISLGEAVICTMKIFLYLAAVALCSAQDFGHIENLQVTSGDGSITLEWDFVAGDPTYKLHKYTILTDNDFSTDLRCPAAHCTTIIDYLDACKEHTFDVTPVFDDTVNGGSVNGDTSSISGFTNDLPPSSPSNLRVLSEDDSGTTLQWDAPTKNPICVQSYKRRPQTLTGTTSNTDKLTDKHTGKVRWMTSHSYSITYGEVESRRRFSYHQVEDFGDDYDHHANIGPLEPCTEYLINITSIGKKGQESVSISKQAATNDTEPLPPKYVVVDTTSEDSIEVSWAENEADRCIGFYIICWNDDQSAVETCVNVTDTSGKYTITDLLACTHYDVSITVVTPGGIHSETVRNFTNTGEAAPGHVEGLSVVEVHPTSLKVYFEEPNSNPQCVAGYDIMEIDLDHNAHTTRRLNDKYRLDTITGLEPCTDYEIKVRAFSKTGQYVSDWQVVDQKTSCE